ncbi:NAD(P)-dependent alcohol dehydrogenase [Cnuibacter physcomitrellae]|uniref:NAD(P)-dependent alcohol dehydrogenase n=1 Tax=Cnuibacter physcomitrellae TaxID=1619308 RepID=UPI0021757156|nr:NAD(P)-dependent alcohol dehydrogenase [Cnuibacter physcomitrellae]MCS5498308.1 NAD(P)-dependent alcohol dehydrogenase [Cnuibacter physcomitrellae]
MTRVAAMAKLSAETPFEPVLIERRELREHDVRVEIAYTGICHSDLHHAFNDRGTTTYPIVPGHEIAGVVAEVGAGVTRFAVGDRIGVGCTIDSCGECDACLAGLQQYCRRGNILTYGVRDYEGSMTYGGYSRSIVVNEHYAMQIPDSVSLESAAPLMCGGITLYSPLRHWKAGPGKKVGIVGLGGLGHIGVQIAAAMGAHTVVFNLDPRAEADALRFGADEFRVVTDPRAMTEGAGTFDIIISTVPATFDVNAYLNLLTIDGTFVNLGVPNEPLSIVPHSLLNNRRSISGSLSGGLPETQEMIEFCAEHGVVAEVETVSALELEDAYDRLARGDVRFRFVIDIGSLPSEQEVAERSSVVVS